MAIWNGSALNTDELTTVVNYVYNKKFIDQVKDKHGLLELVMGEPSNNPDKAGPKAFKKMRTWTGKNIEVKLLGNYKSIGTIADGSAEVASTVGQVIEKYGAAEFKPTHFNDQHWVPKSQYKRFRGNEAKTVSFIQDEYDWLMASWIQTLADGIASTNDQQRTTLGGWEYAVVNDNTYGTINRSDAGNVDFRGYEKDSFGAFTLDALQTEYTTHKAQGGHADIMIGAATVYNLAVKAIRDEGTLVNNYGSDGKVAAGGSSFSWQGMDLILDPHTTSGVLGLLESDTFVFYLEETGMENTLEVDTSKKAALMFDMDAWAAFICVMPKRNAKLNGITA